MYINANWWGAFASHIRGRSSEIEASRLDELLAKIATEIAVAKSSQLMRSGRPEDEQAVIARATVFFRKHPEYGIF